MSWSVVVPTNRPDRFVTFLEAWANPRDWQPPFEKHDVHLIVVQDLPETDPVIESALEKADVSFELHDWNTITAKYIPRQSDMIRSWGIYRAWKLGSKYTLTLDDDVTPERDIRDIFEEYERGFHIPQPFSPYLSVGSLTSFEGQMRGFPFQSRKNGKVVIQYGGWHGVLDYDASTQLAGVPDSQWFEEVIMPVPYGAAVTTCIMNAAWRTEDAMLMWQLPLLEGRYNRYGDIWSGLIQKKVLDARGDVMLINGKASVRHDRASDPQANWDREQPGVPHNERLWYELEQGTFEEVAANVHRHFILGGDVGHANHFEAALTEWVGLFQ